ncbi:MAG TPA: hypothetical protein VJR22_08620 [Candidatus Nitrosotalea sp.]|nr:hypothetical protein [Nitrososphaerota archaeon]HKU33891.1 hypothetical protein [Candidatus Nitrosotalea sp.]
MSDEFLRVAKQEIQSEISSLEQIISRCNNDEHLFENSQIIEECLHKIKGLAPMIGQEKIGEIAKISDSILKYIISEGVLSGSYSFMSKTIGDMKRIFHGLNVYDISDFKKLVHDRFPTVLDL